MTLNSEINRLPYQKAFGAVMVSGEALDVNSADTR